MAIRALILDHDGTLVDSEPVHHRAWVRVLKPLGVNYSFETYISAIGISAPVAARRLQEMFDLTLSPEELLERRWLALKAEIAENGVPLMPGVMNLIQWAKEVGLKLGVASGSDRSSVLSSLRAHTLEDDFEAVSTSTDVVKSKPAPDVYTRTIELLGVRAEEVIAVEDSPTGIQSAKEAQLMCLALRHSYIESHLLAEANHIFSSCEEILRHIRDIYGKGR